jgi:flagellar biosynthesis chaperone FliJ
VDRTILSGNKKGLKQTITQLLIVFFEILDNQKDIIDISYDEILDRVFKLKEKEKDMITDRLKGMSDELRDADTILKINKLGVWSKGLQKGLTTYVKETYDEERDFREEMEKIEKNLRSKNKNIGNQDLDILMEDYLEQRDIDDDIERDAYDMRGFTEDYDDGNFEGDEVENYGDYDS